MLNFCTMNKENVVRQITNGTFKSASLSQTNLVDDIILTMYNKGIIECIEDVLEDKRGKNTSIPFDAILTLSIAAKMKVKTNLSDVPYAIQDHRVLANMGYNIVNYSEGAMRESSLRRLWDRYSSEELISSYNKILLDNIMPKIDARPTIHLLDCTDLEVNLANKNYEGAEITKNKSNILSRGYKLGTLRGLYEDTGIIEEICFGSLKTHDLNLTKSMIINSRAFKEGDCLVNDRGFLDRDMINKLKTNRKVDSYVPLKSNMTSYNIAVDAAKGENNWENHPTREHQKIALITDLGPLWMSKNPKKDVELNAAVSWDTKSNEYFVFITTDLTKTAKQIIQIYELRREIEEDYRQLKDFWQLDKFSSTKLNMVTLHIVTILLGYLFFQIFTTYKEGEQYSHKCLPVIMKNYISNTFPYLIFYTFNEFAILSINELCNLYNNCNDIAKIRLKEILEKT